MHNRHSASGGFCFWFVLTPRQTPLSHPNIRRARAVILVMPDLFGHLPPHTHEYFPDFLHDGRLITPFLAFSATHPQVFVIFLACVSLKDLYRVKITSISVVA